MKQTRSSRPEMFCNKFAGVNKCFPVNFLQFLRTPFLTEHLRWLLLANEFVGKQSVQEERFWRFVTM